MWYDGRLSRWIGLDWILDWIAVNFFFVLLDLQMSTPSAYAWVSFSYWYWCFILPMDAHGFWLLSAL